jgi:hypothetical protein
MTLLDLGPLLDSRSLLLLLLAAVVVPGLILWDALRNDHKSDLGARVRRFLCEHGWHRRRGETVRRRGRGHIARCRGCGVMLHRETRADRWRTVTDEAEAAALREKRPSAASAPEQS